jgi:serine/threonine protein phosphatase PrpC
MDFKSFGFSDAGRSRHQNEDSYLCNEKEGLFLVADGMGGHVAGEEASQLAIQSVEEFVSRSRSGKIRWSANSRKDLTPEQACLLAGIVFANRRILKRGKGNPALEGMATTLVGALTEDHHLSVVNVGDSRLYRIRDGKIVQLTQDHSLVGEQERQGILTEDEARKHPQRHILTSALGISTKPKIDVFRTEIMPQDLFLLCSDGLHTMLDDNAILKIISAIEDKSLYKIGLSLVLKANLAGGTDNITVVLLGFS